MNTFPMRHHGAGARGLHALYVLLNPMPIGCFVAAFIFDAVYAGSGELLWVKAAAWLIAIGLLLSIIPRLIDLTQVWITSRHTATARDRLAFGLDLLGVAAAIVNAFVHSRDAYGVMPAALWLSACTVLLLGAAQVVGAMQRPAERSTVPTGRTVHG